MTPILEVQQRLRELGRLRMGHKDERGFPVKRETWRLTSASADLLRAASRVVGGEVRPWTSPSGEAFELLTDQSSLDVAIPPGQVLSQHMELWTGGGCQRRCDGVTEYLQMKPCRCPRDEQGRVSGKKGTVCEPHTRLNVLLPWLPGIGVWRLETLGWNAAAELSGVAQLLAAASANGQVLPAQLRIEARQAKRPGEPTKRFIVPVLDVDARLGDVLESIGAIGGPTQAPALEPGTRATQRLPLPERTGDHDRQAPAVPDEIEVPVIGGDSASSAQQQLAVIQCREAGLDDAGRHALVHIVTDGRTESSRELLSAEVDQVVVLCELLQGGHARLDPDAPALVRTSDGKDVRVPVDVTETRAWINAQGGTAS